MKKLIFTLIFAIGLVSFSQAQTVLFDPVDYVDTVANMDNWTLDTIDGVIYMQVISDGWSSAIYNMPAITGWEGSGVMCKTKYSLGTSDTASNELSNFKTVIKFAANGAAGEVAMTTDPAKGEFDFTTGTIPADCDSLNYIQIFGQYKGGSWGPTTGDTLWFGKITTYDATVVFDPASYVGTLPDGMEIVTEEGEEVLKMRIIGWDNFLDIIPDYKMGDLNTIVFKQKVDPDTTSLDVANLNYWLKPIDTEDNEIVAHGEASTATLTEVEVSLKPNVDIAQIQFTIQNTDGWGTADGAFLYIGKITAVQRADELVAPRVTYVAINKGDEAIVLEGIQKEDFWLDANEAVTDQKVNPDPDNITEEYPVNDDDNSAFWYAAWDTDNLYLFVDITDDVPVPMTELTIGSIDQQWMNDGLEVFVDMKDRRIVGKRITSEQHQLRWNLDRTDADTSALGGNYCDFGGIKGSTNYTLEIAISWKGIAQGSIPADEIDQYIADSIIVGKKIAVELSVIDADVENDRKSILNWSNNTGDDEAYTNSQYFGQIELGPEGAGGTSVKQTNTLSARIYPNPANETLTVSMEGMTQVVIYNLTGQQVMVHNNQNNNTLNVSDLTAGLYIVEVRSAKGSAMQKVTIK